MKYQISEKNTLLVFLEKEDVRALHLRTDGTLATDESSKAVLNAVYRDAALASGFVPAGGSTRVIELLRFEDGSMLLCFSFRGTRPKMKVIARCKQPLKVYEFATANNLDQFFLHAQALKELPEAVFEQDGNYRFLIRATAQNLENLLKEYSVRLTDPFTVSSTKEYWRKIY